MDFINELRFDEKGLIPAVVQNSKTGEVLMVAYMNEEAMRLTCTTKKATFWSRSRNELWVKGETSGNYMMVEDIRVDCDCDCILIKAEPAGPACHTGERSCFYRHINNEALETDNLNEPLSNILERLTDVTLDRKLNPKEGSYTNYLLDKGEDKIIKKVGEEAAEVLIAAKNRDKGEISYEAADLLYHMTVMLVDNDMTWKDIFEELERRR